jgi:hypothetical protein
VKCHDIRLLIPHEMAVVPSHACRRGRPRGNGVSLRLSSRVQPCNRNESRRSMPRNSTRESVWLSMTPTNRVLETDFPPMEPVLV